MRFILFALLLELVAIRRRANAGLVDHSNWYVRSSEFMQTDLMQTLR